MCETCPTTGKTMGTNLVQGDCGQCWLWDGAWRAVPQFVYRKAAAALAELTYQNRANLLGPDNVTTPTCTPIKDLEWLGENYFCPWQDDWPKDAVWYYALVPNDPNSLDLKWQSPFTEVPGVGKKWVFATIPVKDSKWLAASKNGVAQYLQDLNQPM